MPKTPLLKPRQVIKALEGYGWKVVRQKGSHIILVKEKHPATLSIPNHTEVARGTLTSLLLKAGISIDAFIKQL